MINLQARAFSKAGYGVLILDLYGTGDSEGTLGDASIAIWQQDILAALSWLKKTSGSLPILWAMRSGALIAGDLLQQYPDITDHMLLWSPVGNGKKFITQFMRIKLAADISTMTGGTKISMKDLWTRLEAGENIEIAGYELAPELAYGLSSLSLENLKLAPTLSVKWIETSLSEPAVFSPVVQKTIQCWRNKNIKISAIAVQDISFWALQEPETAHNYMKQTQILMAN